MSILVIAEKPSVSRELAKVLGADQNRKTHIDGSGYMVSWCLGHLVGLKYPNDYGNNWSEKQDLRIHGTTDIGLRAVAV